MNESRSKKYAQVVEQLSSFSKNQKLKVGCIILKNERIVSSGYNGTLPGDPEPVSPDEKQNTVHAEMNALMNCCINGIATNDCQMFVSHFPCDVCTKLAIMAGIKEIFYVHDYQNEENPFKDKIKFIKIENGES